MSLNHEVKCQQCMLRHVSVAPKLSGEDINLTGRSLRPRTLSNKRPRQTDRLIYCEHDTDVTAPFIFSLCQCIKMQGV